MTPSPRPPHGWACGYSGPGTPESECPGGHLTAVSLCYGNTSLPRLQGAQSTQKTHEALCPPQISPCTNTNMSPGRGTWTLICTQIQLSSNSFLARKTTHRELSWREEPRKGEASGKHWASSRTWAAQEARDLGCLEHRPGWRLETRLHLGGLPCSTFSTVFLQPKAFRPFFLNELVEFWAESSFEDNQFAVQALHFLIEKPDSETAPSCPLLEAQPGLQEGLWQPVKAD